jgi:hypothetical protein
LTRAAPLTAVALLAAIALAGCYGETDLATNIDENAATLNSRGTTNNGPANAFFEYWKTATPGTKLTTPAKAIPGGVSGPFSQRVSGLDPHTSYSFRLCGADQSSGGSPVCAQTRSFITGRASVQAYGDTFAPYGENGWDRIDVNVAAGPAGGNPIGRVSARFYNAEVGPPGGVAFPIGSATEENVTCIAVQGNVAVVGFLQIPSWEGVAPYSDQQFAYIVDGGPAGSGQDRFAATLNTEDRDPTDCTIPANPAANSPLRKGEAAVSGAQAGPTAPTRR